MENNTFNYEQVLGDVAAYIATEYDFSPSEAVGIVMNAENINEVIEDIKTVSCHLEVPSLAEKIMQETPIQ